MKSKHLRLSIFIMLSVFLFSGIVKAQNTISINNKTALPGSNIEVEVAITNTGNFVAFQMDIPLPAGFSYDPGTIALSDRATANHSIAANIISGNILRILSHSDPLTNYQGNSGVIATFNVIAPIPVGNYTFNITDAFISSSEGTNILTGTTSGTITLAKGTPIIDVPPTATDIVYGQSLSESGLSGGSASYNSENVPGSFNFTSPGIEPNAGTYSASVTFTPTDTDVYNEVIINVDVEVAKADPVVSVWPDASPITFGESLAESTLTGGTTSVPGSFSFDDTTIEPNVGTYVADVTFYPTDDANYNTVSGTVDVTVNKASADVFFSDLNQDYTGSPLTVTVTTDPVGLTTTVTYDGSLDPPTNAGSYNVVATVVDDNYDGTASDTFTINSIDPVVTAWPSASDITYLEPLSESNLTGGTANVAGTFSFTDPGTILPAGTHNDVSVTFTPDDDTNYNEITGVVTVIVNKAIASITITNTTQVYNGTPRTVNTSTTPPGLSVDVTYDGVSDGPINAGTYNVLATIDDDNYEGSESATLTITKATALINISNLTHTFDGNPKEVTVSTTPAGLAYDVTYDGSPDPPVEIGDYAVEVTIDDDNYEGTETATMSITGKITPDVVWPTATDITYGDALSDSNLEGGSASTDGGATNIEGSFDFVNPAHEPNAGTYTASVIFTPDDTDLYNTVTGNVDVIVHEATPNIISWPVASNITYGEALGSSDLTGGEADVDGEFIFNNPGEILNAGSYDDIDVTFVPDNDNYNTVAGTVSITVNKASAIVELSNLTQTYTGAALSPTAITTPAGLSVDITYNGSGVEPTNAGSYNVVATIDEQNYEGSAEDTFVIEMAVPEITTWPTASDIVYGDLLGESDLTGGVANVPGEFVFDNPELALNAGTHTVDISFIPDDEDNYEPIAGTVDIIVHKAIATIEITNIEQTYNGNPRPVTVTTTPAGLTYDVTYDGAAVVPVNAGSYNVEVTINEDNYEGSETATLAVNKATATVALSNLTHTFDGAPKEVTVTTTPSGLNVEVTYDDDPTPPSAVGTYNVIATVLEDNYEGQATGTMEINDKITPDVVWPTATAITYGESLADSNLEGGSASTDGGATNVPGSFTFANPDLEPNAGEPSVEVVFTPENEELYNIVAGTISIVVHKATANVEITNLEHTYDGLPKTVIVNTDPAGLDVIITYNEETDAPVNAGSYEVIATINDDNYEGVAVETMLISKADPVITVWPEASDITYGDELGESALSGGSANVAGDFEFTNENLILDAGTHTVDVTFYPEDSDNYNEVEGTTSITVNKALATVTLSDLSQPYTGEPLSVTVTTDPEGLAVVVTYDGSEDLPVNEGTYTVVATVVDDNYEGEATDVFEITEPVQYTITTSVSPDGAGTITSPDLSNGEGSFDYGDELVLTAEENQGWEFYNWTIEGVEVETELVYTHTVTSDAEIVANFTPVTTYTLTLIAVPEDGGSVVGGGEYEEGDDVSIVATPAPNWSFDGWFWADELVSSSEEFDFVMPGENVILEARFGEVSITDPSIVNISMYPNPTRGQLNISSDNIINEIQIFDIAGKLIYTNTEPSKAYQINLSGINPGMYFINFITNEENIIKKLQFSK